MIGVIIRLAGVLLVGLVLILAGSLFGIPEKYCYEQTRSGLVLSYWKCP
mgnify:CR=1 FL=1